MSEKPWTRGPWFIIDDSPNGVLESEDAQAIVSEGEKWHIAAVWNDVNCVDEETVWPSTTSKANARLIAAAPDLYDALYPIAAYGEISAKIIERAQAAIAKARGDQ